MKLGEHNLGILKALTSINDSMLIEKDDDVFVISPCGSVIGYAALDPQFKENLSIYEMKQFLSVLSLFEDPDIVFSDDGKMVTVGSDKQKVRYLLTDESFVNKGKALTMPEDAEIKFTLPSSVIDKVSKASDVLGLKYISISSDGTDIFIGACEVDDENANKYTEKVADGNGTVFNFHWKAAKVKFISADYEVICSSQNICEFKSDVVTYWVGMEASSSYG